MIKLAIVVGHNSASQGAVRQDTGESERPELADAAIEASEALHAVLEEVEGRRGL